MTENALKPSVLFVCRHNRCRSRVAEALARERCPEGRFLSAGSDPAPAPDAGAAAALARRGLTLFGPGRALGSVTETFELVVTLCDEAACPTGLSRLGKTILHRPVSDPSGKDYATPEERRAAYDRMVRDVEALLEEILPSGEA